MLINHHIVTYDYISNMRVIILSTATGRTNYATLQERLYQMNNFIFQSSNHT